MSEYHKCACLHCGQPIEYPAEGTDQIVSCPACQMPVTLTPTIQSQSSDAAPPTKDLSELKAVNEPLEEGQIRSDNSHSQNLNLLKNVPSRTNVPPVPRQKPRFENLTEETIRKVTQKGETPLHRAAKVGRICDIPKHLLATELFMVKDNSFSKETPLHLAAKFGHLDKVPKEFLTKETLTVSSEYGKKESKTGSTPPRTETPLHTAARCGHAEQIPYEFLTPEFLCIEASGYRNTVLHQLAFAKRLDLVPDIYANSEMWNLKNSQGQTPREILEGVIEREDYVAKVRVEPATEKQKEKLRYFGYAFDEKITKGQASDALDKCVRDFPEKDRAYYARPATDEQLANLRIKVNRALFYGEAKDMISQRAMEKRHDDRLAEMEGIRYEMIISEPLRWGDYPQLTSGQLRKAATALEKINPSWARDADHDDLLLKKVTELYPGVLEQDLRIKCWDAHDLLDDLFKLKSLPPRAEDLELFAQHGITYFEGDAFSIYAAADLVRSFEKMHLESGDYTNISMASAAASADPAIKKAAIILGESGKLVFTWPKSKLKQWYRKGAKY